MEKHSSGVRDRSHIASFWSWDEADAQESQGDSLSPWATQPPITSRFPGGSEADRYLDSGTPGSVLLIGAQGPWGT